MTTTTKNARKTPKGTAFYIQYAPGEKPVAKSGEEVLFFLREFAQVASHGVTRDGTLTIVGTAALTNATFQVSGKFKTRKDAEGWFTRNFGSWHP